MLRARRILLSTEVVSTGTLGLLGPIYAIYVEKIGGGILEASGTYAIFALIHGGLVMLLGKLTDRVKEQKYFMVAGFLISAVGFLGYLFVKNLSQLIAVQTTLGIAMAIMTPANYALYTKNLDRGKFAAQWGTMEGIYYITQGLTAFAGGIVASYIGFQAIFIFMAGISFVAGIYIWLLPKRVL